jgi:hypothetical protein
MDCTDEDQWRLQMGPSWDVTYITRYANGTVQLTIKKVA